MNEKTAGIDELIATFSSHVSGKYPHPTDFCRNFDLLLKGKRERAGEVSYLTSLERNIVFLDALVGDAERFLDQLLANQDMGAKEIESALMTMEKEVHGRTAKLHTETFIEGTSKDFQELATQRKTGGPAYREKLEFNYRYLMTVRILIFELIAIVAAVLAEYRISPATPDVATRIRNQIELTAHYYLGNVTVGEEPKETPK